MSVLKKLLGKADPKIAFFEVEPWEADYLKERLKGHELVFTQERLSMDNAAKYSDADIISLFVNCDASIEVLSKFPKLKFINTSSTGFDHINLPECDARKIPVSNVPSYGENTVAEHAFALLLALSRKIIPSIEKTRKGKFETGPELRGFDLKGKTIGVLGTGRIGVNSIRMAKGFQMNVIGYDAFPNKQLEQDLGFKYVSFEELLKTSDVITVHVPALPQTFHMINKDNIKLIKKGCILINTARGTIVETEAIIEGLNQGIFAGVGLDVLESEVELKEEKQLLSKRFDAEKQKLMLEEHILIEYDNVIVTPHNAFNSMEALKRILDTAIDNISKFASGSPVNVVNLKKQA